MGSSLLLATWEGKSCQSNCTGAHLNATRPSFSALSLGSLGLPSLATSTLHDCQLHPSSLLVPSDAKGIPASQLGRRLVVTAFCHAYCMERAISGGLGGVQGLSTGEKMHMASIGAARLAGAEWLLLPNLPTASLLEREQ